MVIRRLSFGRAFTCHVAVRVPVGIVSLMLLLLLAVAALYCQAIVILICA
jgi:hypothetical protein